MRVLTFFLEHSSYAFSWINKKLDNIKMQGTTVKLREIKILSHFLVPLTPHNISLILRTFVPKIISTRELLGHN